MSLAFLTITILTPERWKLKSELLCFPDGKGCWAVSCFLAVCSASSENALVSALDYFNWVVDFLMFRFYLERWSSPANNTPIGCPVPNSPLTTLGLFKSKHRLERWCSSVVDCLLAAVRFWAWSWTNHQTWENWAGAHQEAHHYWLTD